jgi:hypothetical protein
MSFSAKCPNILRNRLIQSIFGVICTTLNVPYGSNLVHMIIIL